MYTVDTNPSHKSHCCMDIHAQLLSSSVYLIINMREIFWSLNNN